MGEEVDLLQVDRIKRSIAKRGARIEWETFKSLVQTETVMDHHRSDHVGLFVLLFVVPHPIASLQPGPASGSPADDSGGGFPEQKQGAFFMTTVPMREGNLFGIAIISKMGFPV